MPRKHPERERGESSLSLQMLEDDLEMMEDYLEIMEDNLEIMEDDLETQKVSVGPALYRSNTCFGDTWYIFY
jgi:tRNA pseudouridine-54 N-methylase